jgi:hypothetical protein
MPKWSRDYLLTSILGAIALALGVAVTVEWAVLARHRGRDLQPPPAKTAPAAEPGIEEEDFELPALDDYEQMAERPLFMENRRPGVETAEAAAPPPPPTPMTLKLMGIVSTPKEKTALLMDSKGKYKRLKVQDTLDGWMLVELSSDKATLQQGDKREDLPLLKKRPKTAPPPPGTPPQAGQLPRPGPMPGPVPGQRPPPPPAPQTGDENLDVPEDESDTDIPDEDTDTTDADTGDESQ